MGWYILILIVVLCIQGAIASVFRRIAAEKGFDEAKFFWCPFLLGLIGYMMVIALPDRKQKPAAVEELPNL